MSDLRIHNERVLALEGMATRYEALVRDLGVLRELEELDPVLLEPEDVGAQLVGAIAREDGAEQCSIMLLDPVGGKLVLRAVGTRFAPQGYAVSDDVWHGKSFSLGEGIAGRVAETRRPLRIHDTRMDSYFLPIPESPVTVNALMCFPLIADDELLGVLNLSHSQPGFFTPDREQSTWLLARRVSALIAVAQQRLASNRAEGVPVDAHQRPRPFHAERLHAIATTAGSAARLIKEKVSRIVDALAITDHQTLSEETQVLLAGARRDGLACADLVATLNQFAKLTTAPRLRSPIVLGDMIRDVCEKLATQEGTFLSPTLDLAEGLPSLQGDATQLHQALLAMATNAVSALIPVRDTPNRGGPWLRIGAEKIRQPHKGTVNSARPELGDFIRIFVADNGTGMNAPLVEHCCEPFVCGPLGGTGLGLTTALYVARQHDGWLEIKSEAELGTTVSLFLPVFMPAPSLPDSTPETPSGPSVLLVDDEPLIRNLGKTLLKRLGYHCIVARNGAEALEIFERDAAMIDLVLIDVNMPGLQGPEVLALLREKRPELPGILSSGDMEDSSTTTTLSSAPTSFLKKPYLVATLEEVLRATLPPTT